MKTKHKSDEESGRFSTYLFWIILFLFCQFSFAQVYISNFSDFPAYPYNNSGYMQGGAYVGCGPTTGAMILGYFHHRENMSSGSGLLDDPVSGVNEGLSTAWILHGSTYMNTQANGFGSVYNIESGLESYAEDKGHNIKVMIHASTTYDPNSSAADWLNEYGPYGESWTNDGFFWRTDGTNWWFDANDFCDFVEDKISNGITIFLSIDTNGDRSGDHWVPLVGFDRGSLRYAFYDTYDSNIHWADIHYCNAPGTTTDNSISFVRSITYEGPIQQDLRPPQNLRVLSGYHSVVPFAWNPPDEDPNATLIGYNIYRSTNSGGPFTRIVTQTNRLYYRDESAVNGQSYYYRITAVYSQGESDPSNTALGSAQTGGYMVESGWADTAPTINGVINSSEWAAAARTSVLFPGQTGTVTMMVMNDNNRLYVAFDNLKDNAASDNDGIGVFCDENLDRTWPSSSPSGEGLIQMYSQAGEPVNRYQGMHGTWPDQYGGDSWTTPSGVTQRISFNSGHMQIETSYDLSSSPFNASPGDAIGMLFYVMDANAGEFDGLWPQSTYQLASITQNYTWAHGPFSYGTIELASFTGIPDIAVEPLEWNYGSVELGSYSDKVFVVRNEGNALLHVSSTGLSGLDFRHFSTVSGGTFGVEPGESHNVVIRFNPTIAGSKSAVLAINSDDPDEGQVQIPLTGTGIVVNPAQLYVDKKDLDFGTTVNSLTFLINNTGGEVLTWTLSEFPDKPWITSISPNSGTNEAVITVTVDRSLLATNSDTGVIRVSSNGGNHDVNVYIEKPVAELPEHWKITQNTGNSATVVLPLTVKPNIEGTPLSSGDYIGVFTEAGLCCGFEMWNNQNISITVWGDNDQTQIVDGFKGGELIKYRVYRLSEQKEWNNVAVGYSQGSGLYSGNAYMVLNKFDVFNAKTIALRFPSGWNMFSFNVLPEDASASAILSDVVKNLVILKNGAGESYIPEYGIDQIEKMNFREGYLGYFSANTSLEISGQPVDPQSGIELNSGWSMISYLPDVSMDVKKAMQSIGTQLIIAKDGNGNTFIPEYGINQIGNMQSGCGYQVYLREKGLLTYPASSPSVSSMASLAKSSSVNAEVEHFQFCSKTGENATIVIPTQSNPRFADDAPLQTGDEIGVFTSSGICCGAVVWEGVNTAITVWGDDSQTEEIDGFKAGDTMHYSLWQKDKDMEYPAIAVYQQDSPVVYETNGLSVLEDLSVEVTDVESMAGSMSTDYILRQNYPNPFNPKTVIRYSLPVTGHIDLSVYNVLGQKIATLVSQNQNAGSYDVEWDASNLTSGVYIYRLQAGSHVDTKRMILMK